MAGVHEPSASVPRTATEPPTTADDTAPAWLPTRVGDTWEWAHPDGIELLIAHVSPSSRGLDAWVEMRWKGTVPTPGVILAARFDLMGSRTVASMHGAITGAKINTGRTDWRHLVQAAVYDVIREYLDGPAPIPLASVEPSTAPFVLRPIVGGVGATNIAGAGSVGKSMWALACAASVASGSDDWTGTKVMRTGAVIYVDWEADADTHSVRLRALAAGVGMAAPPDLHYIAADTPLRMWAPALARRCAQVGAALVVIDSVMLARGGDAMGNTDTIAFYSALRTLPCPSLLVDHQSREALREGRNAAFGSVTNENSARMMWTMRAQANHISLYCYKGNNFGQLPRINLALDTKGNDDRLTYARWRHVEPQASVTEGSIWDRIHQILEAQPFATVDELAALTGAKRDTVDRTLRRYAESGRVETFSGGWRLTPDPY